MMKRIISLLIILTFVVTLNVKADGSGPSFPQISVEVKNDNTKCYEEYEFKGKSITLNKGKVIDVMYVDGDRYEYRDEDLGYCYLKSTDLLFGQKEYKLDRNDKLNEPMDLMVVSDSGAQMYSGPLEEYKKLDIIIPKETVVKAYYQIGTNWYYITYNDVSGYVTSLHNDIVYKTFDSDTYSYKQYAINDLTILDASKKEIGTMPVLTEIQNYWYAANREYYITYQGVSGFVSMYDFASDCSGTKIELLSKVPVYKGLNIDEKAKMTKIGTAEINKKYDVKYCYSDYGDNGYYIESLNGWIYLDYESNVDYIETSKEGNIYDTRETRKKHLLERIEVEGYSLYFQKDIKDYNIEIGNDIDKLNIIVTPSDDIEVKISGNENLKNRSKITINIHDDDGEYTYTITTLKRNTIIPTNEPSKESNSTEILLICLGACLLIVITTIVIIILVNKKRKNNVVKDEIPSSNIEKEDIGEDKAALEEEHKDGSQD